MLKRDWAFCISDYETTGVNTKKDLPIEIGMIFTDCTFATIGTYQDYVRCDALVKAIEDNGGKWPTFAQEAYNVHKIDPKAYCKHAVPIKDVAQNVYNAVEGLKKRHKRVILISDNAKFETAFTERIYEKAGLPWNFHFCTWDTNLFLEVIGVGDPIAEHRALRDCALLQRQIVRGLEAAQAYGRTVK